ncbi:transcriptional regulator [Ammoniphilus oxalaticus]|uniref:Transcriptional regulator n=1 Tax=Ammoniphilus oxalaticus TaxID=66863 RepID=A0A419SEB7_9BACL|nr:Crp/Fnr family transcriptional regulator [Ammoniphilus oxalaticus]RKD21685.1 transcriptional regulator [Ammoniphilus oxalaticus]
MEPLADKTFFQLIPDEFKREIDSIAADTYYAQESILYLDGDQAKHLYFIRTGSVKISKTTLEGKELTLYICKPGELIGELALFQSDLTYTTTAMLLEAGTIGVIERIALEELLSNNGRFAVEFMKWMGIAYRRNQSKFRDLVLLGKQGALYSTLIRMTNTYGIPVDNGVQIDLALTNKDLASFIGATRESVNRMLNELRKNKVIDIDNGFITIYNITFLKQFLECDGCPEDICHI